MRGDGSQHKRKPAATLKTYPAYLGSTLVCTGPFWEQLITTAQEETVKFWGVTLMLQWAVAGDNNPHKGLRHKGWAQNIKWMGLTGLGGWGQGLLLWSCTLLPHSTLITQRQKDAKGSKAFFLCTTSSEIYKENRRRQECTEVWQQAPPPSMYAFGTGVWTVPYQIEYSSIWYSPLPRSMTPETSRLRATSSTKPDLIGPMHTGTYHKNTVVVALTPFCCPCA